MSYHQEKDSISMKKPPSKCIEAVKTLTDFHGEDCASYYSRDGQSAVIVINDQEVAEKVVYIMAMLMEALGDSVEDEFGVPLMIPPEPIEA
jgi:hypothetical protein